MIRNIELLREYTADERLLDYLRREIKTFGHDPVLTDITELLDAAQLKLAMWHNRQNGCPQRSNLDRVRQFGS